jgi:hypothetical protein
MFMPVDIRKETSAWGYVLNICYWNLFVLTPAEKKNIFKTFKPTTVGKEIRYGYKKDETSDRNKQDENETNKETNKTKTAAF